LRKLTRDFMSRQITAKENYDGKHSTSNSSNTEEELRLIPKTQEQKTVSKACSTAPVPNSCNKSKTKYSGVRLKTHRLLTPNFSSTFIHTTTRSKTDPNTHIEPTGSSAWMLSFESAFISSFERSQPDTTSSMAERSICLHRDAVRLRETDEPSWVITRHPNMKL